MPEQGLHHQHGYYRHTAVLSKFSLGKLCRAHRSSDAVPVLTCNIGLDALRQSEQEGFVRAANNFLGNHHYNLIKYNSIILDDEGRQAHLEADLWNGETLEKFVWETRKAHNGLPEADVWLIIAQVVSGIHFLCSTHNSDEVFAILSPQTIIICDNCCLKLCVYGEWIKYCHTLYNDKTTGQSLILDELHRLILYLTGNLIDTYSGALQDFYAGCKHHSTSLRTKTLGLIRCPEIQHALVVARSNAGLVLRLPPRPVHPHATYPTEEPGDAKGSNSTSLRSPSSSDAEDAASIAEFCGNAKDASMLIDMYSSPGCDIGLLTLEAMVCVGDLQGVRDVAWIMLQRGLVSEVFQLALSMKNGDIIATIIDFAEEHKLRLRLPVQQAVFSDSQTNLIRAAQTKEKGFQLSQEDMSDMGKIYGSKTSCYCTALMTAAFYGNDEAVVQLLGELGIYDYYGLTALQYGCINASWSRLRYLIPEMKMSRVTWLMVYAALGDVDNVQKCIEELHGQTHYGYTALMFAASNNHIDCVKLLLQEAGSKTQSGRTALILAALQGHVACVQALYPLEKDLLTNGGGTALMAAAEGQSLECGRCLIKQAGMRSRDGYTAIMWAAQTGSAGLVKLLLENEAGYQNKSGWSALMLATVNNHWECVELLAPREAGLLRPGKHTALMLAAECGYHKCVEILLPYEKRMQNTDGYTALMYAADGCHVECVSALARYEFDIKDAAKRTALMRVRKRVSDPSFARKDDAQDCLDILTELLKPKSMLPENLMPLAD
ncbi:Ankyrin repeat protein 1 [Giardia duodenalis]|uniref:Ankyrin repeat protein 1 n=1 Tax=Giardia intestinalis (strain ATCC 50803 / WB clone C6) TaxID=184922 RepID=A8BHB2_GIAIC|nr:Ankyrin repeat protein 1 [Giardia intestinalis]KAE8301671.1 Ankyrin repeat protein 1 [Giardia intestinalis]|eukprot:XP_001707076.1 Protein 21.1 [Giardia lamblia ATCC 50803]